MSNKGTRKVQSTRSCVKCDKWSRTPASTRRARPHPSTIAWRSATGRIPSGLYLGSRPLGTSLILARIPERRLRGQLPTEDSRSRSAHIASASVQQPPNVCMMLAARARLGSERERPNHCGRSGPRHGVAFSSCVRPHRVRSNRMPTTCSRACGHGAGARADISSALPL